MSSLMRCKDSMMLTSRFYSGGVRSMILSYWNETEQRNIHRPFGKWFVHARNILSFILVKIWVGGEFTLGLLLHVGHTANEIKNSNTGSWTWVVAHHWPPPFHVELFLTISSAAALPQSSSYGRLCSPIAVIAASRMGIQALGIISLMGAWVAATPS